MIIDLLVFIGILLIIMVVCAFGYEPHGARNNPNPYPTPKIEKQDTHIDRTVLSLAQGMRNTGKNVVIEIHGCDYTIREI